MIEKGYIEKLLKQYKTKKSLVESSNSRIKAWEYAMNNPEVILENYYSLDSREIGMPGSPNRNTSSPIERELSQKELTRNTLKQWIKEEQSRIFHTKLEVEHVENALNSLTQQERYIIECKYFENMNWRDIELNLNSKYRQTNYITAEGIRKINNKIISKLELVIGSLYEYIA